jgi:hypothetical protein
MKNAVFWNVMPRGSSKNRCFGGTYWLHHQGGENQRARQLLVTANITSSLIVYALMMEAIHASETLVRTRATWHHIKKTAFFSIFLIHRLVLRYAFNHDYGAGVEQNNLHCLCLHLAHSFKLFTVKWVYSDAYIAALFLTEFIFFPQEIPD